jgi:hypothetical protein
MRVSDPNRDIIPGELVVSIRIRDLRISINTLLIKYPCCELLRIPRTSGCLELHLVLGHPLLLVQAFLQLIFISIHSGSSCGCVLGLYRPLIRGQPRLFWVLYTITSSNLAVIGEVILRLLHRIIVSWPCTTRSSRLVLGDHRGFCLKFFFQSWRVVFRCPVFGPGQLLISFLFE